jgi:MFS family permease
VSLFLTAVIVPSQPKEITIGQRINPYFESLKQISKSKSATACLLARLLAFTGGELAVFAFAFYRTRFAASTELIVVVYEIAILLYFLAPLVSGRLICKYGSKRVLTVSTFISACFMGIIFVAPNLWVAITMDMAHVWFGDMAIPAFACLFLEQVPKFRGTMFSLGTLFNYIEKMIATILGGAILIFTSGAFMGVGFSFAAVTIVGCTVLVFFVKKSGTITSPIH